MQSSQKAPVGCVTCGVCRQMCYSMAGRTPHTVCLSLYLSVYLSVCPSVLACCLCAPLLQGGDRCLRCTNGIPHSPHADFFKFAEVVVSEADVRKLSKAALDDMAGWCVCLFWGFRG